MMTQLRIPHQALYCSSDYGEFNALALEISEATFKIYAPAQGVHGQEVELLVSALERTDLLLLNTLEAATLVRRLETTLPALLDEFDISRAIVTHGAQGCALHALGKPSRAFLAFPTQVVDTTGAGDAFAGTLVAMLLRGTPYDSAIALAQAAASLTVEQLGACPTPLPTLAAIAERTRTTLTAPAPSDV